MRSRRPRRVARRANTPSGPGADWIAVFKDEALLGLLTVSSLLIASPDARLGTLAQPPVLVVSESDDVESVAWLAVHAGAEVVVVEDAAGRFKGVVSAAAFLPLLVHGHETDMAILGGFMRGAARARTASEERVLRRVLHRAPWLLLGLAGVVVAAQIVRAFEAELEATVALAYFLPGIVYMADAVGTQTGTLAIRGLSVGIPIGRILRLELTTGLFVGVLLSLAVFPLAVALTDDTAVAAAWRMPLTRPASRAELHAWSPSSASRGAPGIVSELTRR